MPETVRYYNLLEDNFIQACRDYAFLMNQGYPERGVLKLTGDRYRLSGDQRTVLYRGISSFMKSSLRKALLVSDIAGKYLVIDGYNVLLTLLNYRHGKITFVSTDDILRDAGSLHGRFHDNNSFTDCIRLMIDFLSLRKPARADIYLDAPVSHSEKHAGYIREKLLESPIAGNCYVIHSADWALYQKHNGIIATSDTAIIERAMAPVIDMPREILEHFYGADFLELGKLLSVEQT